MLDMRSDFQFNVCDKLKQGPLDPRSLMNAMKSLSPAELAELEDDLDFAQFTGIRSSRVTSLISDLSGHSSAVAA